MRSTLSQQGKQNCRCVQNLGFIEKMRQAFLPDQSVLVNLVANLPRGIQSFTSETSSTRAHDRPNWSRTVLISNRLLTSTSTPPGPAMPESQIAGRVRSLASFGLNKFSIADEIFHESLRTSVFGASSGIDGPGCTSGCRASNPFSPAGKRNLSASGDVQQ